MSQTKQDRNKALVLQAFDTLFNKRDYAAAEPYWSPDYIQHSAHIPPGRQGLFELVKAAPPTLKHEPGLLVADGDFVILHGRFSGLASPVNRIAADIASGATRSQRTISSVSGRTLLFNVRLIGISFARAGDKDVHRETVLDMRMSRRRYRNGSLTRS